MFSRLSCRSLTPLARLAFAFIVLFALYGHGTAVAMPKAKDSRTYTSFTLGLKGSHGYRVEVQGERGVVFVRASRAEAEADYAVPGRVVGRRMHANLGRLGMVSVRFEGPMPSVPPVKGGCRSENKARSAGSFKGAIRFSGEEGFTAVSATEARGTVLRYREKECEGANARPTRKRRKPPAGASGNIMLSALAAGKVEKNRAVDFFFENSATPEEDSSGTGLAFVNVDLEEHRGRIEIFRANIFATPGGALTVSPPQGTPVSGRFEAVGQFEGSAEYARAPGGEPTWTGDLSASLPGAANIPLAGPGFKAKLCHGKAAAPRIRRCFEEANELFFEGLPFR